MSYPCVGVDIVRIQRFKNVNSGSQKMFTEHEREYCRAFANPAPHFAGIFAAKEAASKALGTLHYPFLTLEVRHEKLGAPYVCTKGGKRLRVAISISHDGAYAIAVAAKTSSGTR